MQLFSALIKPNSLVRIERLATSQDSSGGTVESYATVVDNVPCLVTQIGGNRDGRFSGTDSVMSGTCTGNDPNIGRGDVRFYFHTGPAAGLYARVDSDESHGPTGGYSMIETFHRAKWSQIRVGV